MVDRQSRVFRTAVTIEHRVLGVAFLALLLLGAWFTYAVFNKAFTEYDEVTLKASRLGLQLPDRADVKVRGVIVGEVIETATTTEGAVLTLGIYPAERGSVPADVSARILPKTLFGEKYVALEPRGTAVEPIRAGAVIEEAELSMEVEQVLRDIYPLLRTVAPAELNHTLTAMATAFEGRGEAIGANLSTLDGYLKRTNPQIPTLVEDLRMLSEVSGTYRAAMPQVARLLRNSVATGDTFIEKEQKIQALFSDVTAFSSVSREFLDANGDNIVRLGEVSVPQLQVYEKYAPEYPCLLDGMGDWIPRMTTGWRGHTLHINLEPLPRQPRGYGPRDQHVNGDKRGPRQEEHCRRAVGGEFGQHNLPPLREIPDVVDGVDDDTIGKRRSAPLIETSPRFAGDAEVAALLLGSQVREMEAGPR
jgi:phospholipid/cholesterol/gamma-HCH transport system substrate-binding protein